MQQIIKFRAWDGNKMWYEDTRTANGNEIAFHFYNSKSKNIGWGIYDNHFGNRIVTGSQAAIFNTPGILMQFTGLEDSKGNQVYVGDIITNGDNKILYVVDFGDGYFGATQNGNKSRIGLTYWQSTIKVVGNIYEHPYLLIP